MALGFEVLCGLGCKVVWCPGLMVFLVFRAEAFGFFKV